MPWHALTLADLEFIEFRQALERAYQREIAVGGSRGYTLYGRKDARDQVVFVPPDAFHLVEQMPSWQQRLRRHARMPNLAGFKAVSVPERASSAVARVRKNLRCGRLAEL
jgi:hypothetical protein